MSLNKHKQLSKYATHIYNALSGQWTLASPSSFWRHGPGLTNVNGMIFAAFAGTETNVVEEFVLTTKSW